MSLSHLSSEGLRHFYLVGRTADGRKWYSVLHFTDEFLSFAGLRLLDMLVTHVASWDAHHACTTRKITFQQFSEIAWAEFTGNWDGE